MNELAKDLQRIPSSTMADVVELRLREYLKKKSLRPGDALPKEQEIAHVLGVSRNVVREALSRLRMLGMIDSRKKRGMILSEPDILGSFERVLDPLMMSHSTMQDLFEIRLVLEMGLADLIYPRMQQSDIDELRSITDHEINKVQKPFRIELEIAFHGKLYRMTRNDTFIRFQNMLLPIFQYVVEYETKVTKSAEVSKVTHSDLVTILSEGSAEDFRQAMKEHLRPHFERAKKFD